MKVMMKYIINSIKKSPWQSLLLIVMLTVSFSVMLFSYEIIKGVEKEDSARIESSHGKADLILKPKSSSEMSFAGSQKIEKLLSGDDAFCGCYVLPFTTEDDFLFAVATDFYRVDNVFDIKFFEYCDVKVSNLNETVFISAKYADDNSLSIGDKISYDIIGEKKEYTVRGIATSKFVGEYDVMVSMSGIIDILIAKSPVFAAFDNNNLPFSEIYIKIADPIKTEYIKEQILNSDFADWQIIKCGENKISDYGTKILRIIFSVMAILSAVIVFTLIYCSTGVLYKKRKSNIDCFLMAGSGYGRIVSGIFSEIAAYSLLALFVGTAVAAAIMYPLQNLFEFAKLGVSISGLISCAVVELFACLLSVTAFIVFNSAKKEKLSKSFPVLLCIETVILFAGLILESVVKTKDAYLIAVPVAVISVLIIIKGMPLLMKYTLTAVGRILDKFRALEIPAFKCAVKNTAQIFELHNFARLITVTFVIVSGLFATMSYGETQLKDYSEVINADYIMLSAKEDLCQKVEESQYTEDCKRMFFYGGAVVENHTKINLVSIEEKSMLRGIEGDYNIPEGNEVVVSDSLAKLFGLENGDNIQIKIYNEDYTFTIAAVIKGMDFFAIIDSSFVGSDKDILTVSAKEGSESQCYEALKSVSDTYGAVVTNGVKLFDTYSFRVNVYLSAARYYFGGNIIMTLVAAINLFAVSYARRKKEFCCYRLSGADRKMIIKIAVCETAVVMIFVLTVSVLFSALVCYQIKIGMASFGCSLC